MKKQRWFFRILFLLLPFLLQASETSYLQPLGFSSDGCFYAFEEYGVFAGSGAPYSYIFILDVDNNDYAEKPLRLQGSEDQTESLEKIRAANLSSATPHLERYGIDAANRGELLLYHPITDLTGKDTRQDISVADRRVKFVEKDFSTHDVFTKYEIILRHISTDKRCPLSNKPAQMFQLSLATAEDEKILQKDSRLPASRGCVLCYRIERVVSYRQKVVVFLHTWIPGFEGFSIRYLAVSGTLKF